MLDKVVRGYFREKKDRLSLSKKKETGLSIEADPREGNLRESHIGQQ
jgi:hypothetical protein